MMRVNYVNIRRLASSNKKGYNLTRNLLSGLCVISEFAVQDTTLSYCKRLCQVFLLKHQLHLS